MNHPDLFPACRRINDALGQHVAIEVVKLMATVQEFFAQTGPLHGANC